MEKNYIKKIITISIFMYVCCFSSGLSQVGINTTAPKGLLDLGDNGDMGLIYPVASLSDVNVQTLINPNGGSLVAGTCVYNDRTFGTGVDSVYPGIYIWNGAKWIPQFGKKDSELFTQSIIIRTGSNDLLNGVLGDQSIVFDNMSLTPDYSGPYKIMLTLQYGAGNTNSVSDPQYVNYAVGSGIFDFNFNGSTTSYALKSYSGSNDDRLFKGGSGAPTLVYTNSIQQSIYVIEENLTRNVNYPFTLTFNQDFLEGFEGDGDISIIPSGDGRGYIVAVGDFICTVEMSYVGE